MAALCRECLREKEGQGFRAPLSLLQSSSAEKVTVIVSFVKALSSTSTNLLFLSTLYFFRSTCDSAAEKKKAKVWDHLKKFETGKYLHINTCLH
ncbi:unnamed protein product [Prunus armeniaca]|uniref:Uncharacterized protein n=1 Tax=Prunus armeniaca TaxID=36596 RepID=A0A6J5XB72_PRUAR|nr:unnamed protein product [Prunus armeniaca]CAB4311196.1 unnamed protein product [Prunus armeniaca]